MNELAYYLKRYVEPTVGDFKRNPTSARHAILSCIVIVHAADRATRAQGSLQQWKKQLPFALIDAVANNAKHVKGKGENKRYPNAIPLHMAVLKSAGAGTSYLDATGARHMFFLVKEAVEFLQTIAHSAP